ncbi:hypothetical protein UVI_02052450 [Ustilaginoidea virens]|nr:hypothetical protein UVI_02052450 [Ustilaginoidea virens]
MDTQKYRLPDHTNSNGTKATLDTRREHIQPTARPVTPPDAVPPPPPPKDTPPPATPPAPTSPTEYVPGLSSYFTPGQNRPGSIYTLSRASFANQLAQLTSLQLPDAESLSSQVSAIPTAQVAARALINASEQIRGWIAKAHEVIGGLDSEDDVEWAAAGGREGLEEVENATARFEDLINAYVGAIEELQKRSDITHVPSHDLKVAVFQMDSIIDEWARIRATLTSVRVQVEMAMEWEELWNNVLGDIQGEMDELGRLVFEMEERRHKGAGAAAAGGADDLVDIGDLEEATGDETPPAAAARLRASSRLSLAALPPSPLSPGAAGLSQDDSSLLALFARMQPLRASLDFLPMRLSVFEARAKRSFPTACEELEMRRTGLDASYKKLEKDAESLRKELGEDRWVIVFRGAGRQAQKMHESVQRSLLKLGEAIDAEVHLPAPPTLAKKVESYEAKKTHYGPAIERVLSIIERGVRDRLTVNGEILRLHEDMQARWRCLKLQMREMDAMVDDMQVDRKSQQLRDSVSSLLSYDRSTMGSGRDTPGSSPPSSVIMSSLGFDPHTPSSRSKARSPSGNHGARPAEAAAAAAAAGRRQSSLPAPPASHPARRAGSRLSTMASAAAAAGTRAAGAHAARSVSTLSHHRPVWNTSTNTSDLDTGHHFKPLNLTTPSPYSRTAPSTQQRSASAATPCSASRLPTLRGAPSRAASESPKVEVSSPSGAGHARLSFRERLTSPGPYSQLALSKPRLTSHISMTALSSKRRVSMQHQSAAGSMDGGAEVARAPRPASSLATSGSSGSRRTSLFPPLMGKPGGQLCAASSRPAARQPAAVEAKDAKPRWRH